MYYLAEITNRAFRFSLTFLLLGAVALAQTGTLQVPVSPVSRPSTDSDCPGTGVPQCIPSRQRVRVVALRQILSPAQAATQSSGDHFPKRGPWF
jgi:hypothetical protein